MVVVCLGKLTSCRFDSVIVQSSYCSHVYCLTKDAVVTVKLKSERAPRPEEGSRDVVCVELL